jgi:hypothetical protein
MKIKSKLYFIFIFISLFIGENTFGYFTSKSPGGVQIKWPSSTSQVNVYFNASNPFGINQITLENIANSSTLEWNFLSSLSLSFGTTGGKNQEGVNEIYFTNDPNVFNSNNIAVAALTQVSYRESDGVILEADILINQDHIDNGFPDNYKVDALNINNYNYFGNVITHELGHLLGLDHSQVMGSTMFWSVSHGQNKISDDDMTGLYSIYAPVDSNRKSISGKVVGSSHLYGVYGVEVEAISQFSGKVIGAAISNTDGTFTIKSLPISDKYFLYVKPSAFLRLSSAYSSVKTNFCDTGKDYRGSFFQACGGGSEGYPQAISLIDSNVDIGNITIRCSLDVPPEYLQKKTDGLTDFNVVQNTDMGIGNTFVGFFSNQDMNNHSAFDSYNIDLRSISTTHWNSLDSGDLFLNVRVNHQNFYSSLKANVVVTTAGMTYSPLDKYVQEADGWINIDTNLYIPINKSTIANNLFAVAITPTILPTGIPFLKGYILPDYSDFIDSTYFYLLTTQIVKLNPDQTTYAVVSSKSYTISDNTSCPDANSTYKLSDYTTKSNTSSSQNSKSVLACGTIKTDDENNGSGPFGMIVGFSLAFVIISLAKRVRFI